MARVKNKKVNLDNIDIVNSSIFPLFLSYSEHLGYDEDTFIDQLLPFLIKVLRDDYKTCTLMAGIGCKDEKGEPIVIPMLENVPAEMCLDFLKMLLLYCSKKEQYEKCATIKDCILKYESRMLKNSKYEKAR